MNLKYYIFQPITKIILDEKIVHTTILSEHLYKQVKHNKKKSTKVIEIR